MAEPAILVNPEVTPKPVRVRLVASEVHKVQTPVPHITAVNVG